MRLSLRSDIEVPAEIFNRILRNLSQRNLKRVRQVCAELGALARPLLFKSISISPVMLDVDRFLNIIRDAELSRAVEELVYREISIPLIPSKDEKDSCEQVIRGHYPSGMKDHEELEIYRPMALIRREYEDLAKTMKSGYDFGALVEGLLVMPNLKRIISRDSRPPGIRTDTAFKPPSLGLLQVYLPASDASLRIAEKYISPEDGFFTVLRALAATGAAVDILVTERTANLLKQGISLRRFCRTELFYEPYSRGFRKLRKISLCVDDRHWKDIALSECILAATNLEHLELSLTHKVPSWHFPPGRCIPLHCLLPSAPLRNLSTLVLEGLHATAEEMASFLVLQAAILRHLTLWNIQLCADGLWKDVLAQLCACEDFHPESFILKSPEDADVRQHQEEGKVPVRILNKDVLHFVNEGGLNPFAERVWRTELTVYDDLDAISDVSDVSDFSMWRDDGLEDSDSDLDGPEYNSDYDTEPDVDSEGESDDSEFSDGF